MSRTPGTRLPVLMTVQETADYLKVSIRTVRRLIAGGELAIERVGRAVRIREDAVRVYLAG